MRVAWYRREQPRARTAAFGLGLRSAALANLLCWPHHLCLMLLAIGPLAAAGIARDRMRRPFAAILTLVLLCYVPLLDRFAPCDWMAVVGMPTLGVRVVWVGVFVYFWRERPDEAAEEESPQTLNTG